MREKSYFRGKLSLEARDCAIFLLCNNHSSGLGFEFTDTLDAYFQTISRLPAASAIRYDNIRVKPIDTFPHTIHFTIEEDSSVINLGVFNTQHPPFE